MENVCGNGYRKVGECALYEHDEGEMGHMTKAEFIDQVVKSSEGMDLTTKAAGELIDSIFGIVGKAIKKRAARKGRNPRTGPEIRLKASKTVGFKPAPGLKKAL